MQPACKANCNISPVKYKGLRGLPHEGEGTKVNPWVNQQLILV